MTDPVGTQNKTDPFFRVQSDKVTVYVINIKNLVGAEKKN